MHQRRKHLTPLERRIVAVQFKEGELVSKIMADHNICRATVANCARQYALPIRRKGRRRKPPPPKVEEMPFDFV